MTTTTDTAAAAAAPTRTFGIEVELHRPAGLTMDGLAAAIRTAGVECFAEGYNHITRRSWKVVTDGSLGYMTGCEVVSPVLSGEAGIAEARRVMEAIAAAGCTVRVDCGLHVHIGTADLNLRNLKNIAKCFVKFENFFDNIMPPSRRADANRYVMSNRGRHGGYTDLCANVAMERLEAATTRDDLIRANQSSRYFKLNMQSLLRQPTIEFRQHSGTTDAAKVENWVRLLLAFVETAKGSVPRPRRCEKEVSPAEDMGRFFRMFSVPTPVRAFYVERRRALHKPTNKPAA